MLLTCPAHEDISGGMTKMSSFHPGSWYILIPLELIRDHHPSKVELMEEARLAWRLKMFVYWPGSIELSPVHQASPWLWQGLGCSPSGWLQQRRCFHRRCETVPAILAEV